tara:strand:+ start:476 stop:709 length:234 start_codon:yes stop_codon:yes gene_type:complete
MDKISEKYVAKALEGYEQNYKGISEAITNVETQLETFIFQRDEMLEGITEMRELLGLEKEDTITEESPTMTLVSEEN